MIIIRDDLKGCMKALVDLLRRKGLGVVYDPNFKSLVLVDDSLITILETVDSCTCKNCKYTKHAANGDEFDCSILMAHTREQALELINSNFGCNKFEAKGIEDDKDRV